MAEHSFIEWTDATWNPVTGCSVVSPGCANCYAMKLAGTRLKDHPSRAGLTNPSNAGPVWNGQVRLNEGWLAQPLEWKRARRIFVCAHGDLFHESVPDAWIDRVFATMALAPHHTFQVLTKRAARMRAYVEGVVGDKPDLERWAAAREGLPFALPPDWPLPNVWLGVSAEDQVRASERILELLCTPAAVRFLSAEPLLGPINLEWLIHPGSTSGAAVDALTGMACFPGEPIRLGPKLDWVIVGGESGPGARPMHPHWARDLRDACAEASVKFFFKQWGDWAPVRIADGKIDKLGSFAVDAKVYHYSDVRLLDYGFCAVRIGKKAAGRFLYGAAHDAMPETSR